MARVLCWNIENFVMKKINDPKNASDSAKRLEHIMSIIQSVNPDIFIIIENRSNNKNDAGKLVKGPGQDGAIELLGTIKTIDTNWVLIPPLQTGPEEGVAVYYKSTNLYFTGPFIWPGGGFGKVAIDPTGNVAGDYPDKLKNNMPQRKIPDGSLYNIGLDENKCAARTSYTDNVTNGLINFSKEHAPYMVTFSEIKDGKVYKNISLFVVHAPAKDGTALNTYIQKFANNVQMVGAQAENEVRVVLGDFNCNFWDEHYQFNTIYNDIIGKDYYLAQPLVENNEKLSHYFTTHIKRTAGAFNLYCSTDAETHYYPCYNYYSRKNDYAIDNALIRYKDKQYAPNPNNFSIINTIVGIPFIFLQAGMPVSNITIPNMSFFNATDDPVAPGRGRTQESAPKEGPDAHLESSFWGDYKQITAVSDHLAISVDI